MAGAPAPVFNLFDGTDGEFNLTPTPVKQQPSVQRAFDPPAKPSFDADLLFGSGHHATNGHTANGFFGSMTNGHTAGPGPLAFAPAPEPQGEEEEAEAEEEEETGEEEADEKVQGEEADGGWDLEGSNQAPAPAAQPTQAPVQEFAPVQHQAPVHAPEQASKGVDSLFGGPSNDDGDFFSNSASFPSNTKQAAPVFLTQPPAAQTLPAPKVATDQPNPAPQMPTFVPTQPAATRQPAVAKAPATTRLATTPGPVKGTTTFPPASTPASAPVVKAPISTFAPPSTETTALASQPAVSAVKAPISTFVPGPAVTPTVTATPQKPAITTFVPAAAPSTPSAPVSLAKTTSATTVAKRPAKPPAVGFQPILPPTVHNPLPSAQPQGSVATTPASATVAAVSLLPQPPSGADSSFLPSTATGLVLPTPGAGTAPQVFTPGPPTPSAHTMAAPVRHTAPKPVDFKPSVAGKGPGFAPSGIAPPPHNPSGASKPGPVVSILPPMSSSAPVSLFDSVSPPSSAPTHTASLLPTPNLGLGVVAPTLQGSAGVFAPPASHPLPGAFAQSAPKSTPRTNGATHLTLEELQRPRAICSFGFGGQLIVTAPRARVIFNSTGGGSNLTAGPVKVLSVAKLVAPDAELSSLVKFPGPLIQKSSKDQVVKYINEIIKSIPTDRRDDRQDARRSLWLLLRLLVQNSGALTTSEQTKELREALLAKDSQFGQGELALLDTPVLPPGELRQVLGQVQDLLLRGKKAEALRLTVSQQLWTHAILIASSVGPKEYSDTVAAFVQATMPGSSPLRSLYLAIGGKDVKAEGESSDRWRESLAMILANRTKGDQASLVQLGDSLHNALGHVEIAHFYLLADGRVEDYSSKSRLVLVGADHRREGERFATPEAIQMTEVLEFAKRLGQSQFTIPPSQVYKFVYASQLAELGHLRKASDYIQSVKVLIKDQKNTYKYSRTFATKFQELAQRVELALARQAAAEQTRGKSWLGTIGNLVSKLVVGEDGPAAQPVGPSPASATTAAHQRQPQVSGTPGRVGPQALGLPATPSTPSQLLVSAPPLLAVEPSPSQPTLATPYEPAIAYVPSGGAGHLVGSGALPSTPSQPVVTAPRVARLPGNAKAPARPAIPGKVPAAAPVAQPTPAIPTQPQPAAPVSAPTAPLASKQAVPEVKATEPTPGPATPGPASTKVSRPTSAVAKIPKPSIFTPSAPQTQPKAPEEPVAAPTKAEAEPKAPVESPPTKTPSPVEPITSTEPPKPKEKAQPPQQPPVTVVETPVAKPPVAGPKKGLAKANGAAVAKMPAFTPSTPGGPVPGPAKVPPTTSGPHSSPAAAPAPPKMPVGAPAPKQSTVPPPGLAKRHITAAPPSDSDEEDYEDESEEEEDEFDEESDESEEEEEDETDEEEEEEEDDDFAHQPPSKRAKTLPGPAKGKIAAPTAVVANRPAGPSTAKLPPSTAKIPPTSGAKKVQTTVIGPKGPAKLMPTAFVPSSTAGPTPTSQSPAPLTPVSKPLPPSVHLPLPSTPAALPKPADLPKAQPKPSTPAPVETTPKADKKATEKESEKSAKQGDGEKPPADAPATTPSKSRWSFLNPLSWVTPKSKKQMKLGDDNSFYYNAELNMWVERGKEEEYKLKGKPAAPPPSSKRHSTQIADAIAPNSPSSFKSDGDTPIPSTPSTPDSFTSSTPSTPGLPRTPSSLRSSGAAAKRGRKYVTATNEVIDSLSLNTSGSILATPAANPGLVSSSSVNVFTPQAAPSDEPAEEQPKADPEPKMKVKKEETPKTPGPASGSEFVANLPPISAPLRRPAAATPGAAGAPKVAARRQAYAGSTNTGQTRSAAAVLGQNKRGPSATTFTPSAPETEDSPDLL